MSENMTIRISGKWRSIKKLVSSIRLAPALDKAGILYHFNLNLYGNDLVFQTKVDVQSWKDSPEVRMTLRKLVEKYKLNYDCWSRAKMNFSFDKR